MGGVMLEATLLRMALVAYALAWIAQATSLWRARQAPLPRVRAVGFRTGGVGIQGPAASIGLMLLLAGLALHTASLVTRWTSLGHGPFTTMHEILSSNLWSLTLVLAVAALAVREVRGAWLAAAPVLLVLALWLLLADSRAGHLPPTYDTILLYLHTLVGKLFLGLLLVAVALSALPWLRGTAIGGRLTRAWADGGTSDARFDELAHRFAAFAFVFDTLMLIVGAVWAQDAWGRWWAWDPLETWAFLTWLALAACLHARVAIRPSPRVFGAWLACVFTIAFLTFFGVPFISTSPHKGAI
jgi:ABC-type transport system involved in cytochrome c biogenesis permease subunit